MQSYELVGLQNEIHTQNVQLGWWDNIRPFSTFVCLFHSELSEAMEGDRKGLMDDHLPEFPMFQVEIADFVIRCLDWLGSKKWDDYDFWMDNSFDDKVDFLAQMHAQVTNAYQLSKDPHYKDKKNVTSSIAHAVAYSFKFADEDGFNLHEIILKKVEYNLHRADHKRENRAKANGKKY